MTFSYELLILIWDSISLFSGFKFSVEKSFGNTVLFYVL